jgi:hypothetical protein
MRQTGHGFENRCLEIFVPFMLLLQAMVHYHFTCFQPHFAAGLLLLTYHDGNNQPVLLAYAV